MSKPLISEDLNKSLVRFMDNPEGYRHLTEELNNLTTPAREELRKLLIAVRTKAEEWGHKNTPPKLNYLLLEKYITKILRYGWRSRQTLFYRPQISDKMSPNEGIKYK